MGPIINGENNESFGFIQEGWFSDRLYIFENGIETASEDEKSKLQKIAIQIPGIGMTSYGNFFGFIMSCLSLATSVRIGEKDFYINNNSLCYYVARKATYNNNRAIGAMHDFYVKNKNKIETSAYDDATIKKVNACFLNLMNNSDVPLELWSIIHTCLESIPDTSSNELDNEIESSESMPDASLTELDDLIEKLTHEFLMPYIRNEVEFNSIEEMYRKPMIETLLAQLEKQFPDVDMAECREKALDSYIMIATHGLFQNFHLDVTSSMNRLEKFDLYLEDLSKYRQKSARDDIEYQQLVQWYVEWDKTDDPKLPTKEFLILLITLAPALEKDFSDSSFSCKDLIEKATKAINVLSEQYKNDPIIKENKEEQFKSIMNKNNKRL